MKSFIDRVIVQPLTDFFQKLIDFLPTFLSALLVFVLGLFMAWVVKLVVIKLFKLLKLDGLFARTGLTETLQKMAVKDSPEKFVGRIFFWLVAASFFIVSLSMLKLPAVEQLFERFLLFLPNLLVVGVILTLGFLLGNFLGRAVLIASVNAGVKLSGLLSKTVKTIVILFSFVMSLEQLGIGRSTVIAAFTILFGGIVLALSLAFGLGGKDIAKDYLEKRFKKDKEEEKNEIKHI